MREIERIAACQDYYQVMELQEGCSDQDVRKAYYRLAKFVHPDKNMNPGAEAAMKTVLTCKEALADEVKRLAYARRPTAPVTVYKEASQTRMKVVKCRGDQRKHLHMTVLKPVNEMSARVVIRSQVDHRHGDDLLRLLDQAWASREDGMLTVGSDGRYRVEAVRYKTKYRFTDGDVKVIVEHIRQKNVESAVSHDRWEVEIRSHKLKEALRLVPTLGTGRRDSLRSAFHDFVCR